MNANELETNAPIPVEVDELVQSQDELSVPVGASDFEPAAGLDPLAGTDSKRRINSSFLLIVAFIALAIGGLFAMKKLTGAFGATMIDTSEVEAKIDAFIQSARKRELSAAESAQDVDDTILAVLNESYTEHQVPLRDIQKNPFVIYTDPDKIPEDLTPMTPTGMSDEEKAKHAWKLARTEMKAEMQKAGTGFLLKSIMGGSRPMAIVNDKIVRVGETIKSGKGEIVFRVTAISSNTVDLVAEDVNYELAVPVTLFLKRDR